MNNDDLGALWSKTGAKGEYMSGIINIEGIAHQIVLFKNRKEKPNQPDWRIYKSKPKPELNENGTEKVEEPNDIPF